MGSELSHKTEATIKMWCVNVLDDWDKEREMMEDVEWTSGDVMRMHKEFKRKFKVVEGEKNVCKEENTDGDDQEEKTKRTVKARTRRKGTKGLQFGHQRRRCSG